MAQPFLETGEKGLLVACLDINHPIGMKPGLCQRGREKVAPRHHPENFSLRPRRNPGRKQRRRRTIHRPIAIARHLMQASKRQPASRKLPVDLIDAKRQDPPRTPLSAFEPLDAAAKLGDNWAAYAIQHGKHGSPENCSTACCATMFLICSKSQSESIGVLQASHIDSFLNGP